MQCPLCHSENVQKLRLVYEFGTKNMLATKRASPPSKRSFCIGLVLIAISLFIFWGYYWASFPSDYGWLYFGVALLVAAILLGFKNHHYNSREWPKLYFTWNQSWHCNKCGAIYTPK